MKRLITTAIVATSMTGCAVTGIPQFTASISDEAVDRIEMQFVGIPYLAGVHGSVVVINSEWKLTAAHNRIFLDVTKSEQVYYHPHCDIALIRENSDFGPVEFGLIYPGDNVTAVGYGGYMPGMTYSHGEYVADAVFDNFPQCPSSFFLSGGGLSGMSGGAVYNESEQLAGIWIGKSSGVIMPNGDAYQDVNVFVPINGVKEWINEITGEDLS